MEFYDVGTFTYDVGAVQYDDIPYTEEPVYMLGRSYSAIHDRDDIKYDMLSRIWVTYRRNFAAIGGAGPTSDSGWGCMLRCGQMMLAEALLRRHLHRDWRWHKNEKNEKYWRILQMFQDKKSAYFSIHQIASMGVSEGKNIGQWFGPNTVAQVLKKLAVYDEWSNLAIHVAMDNTIIEDDIRCLCGGREINTCGCDISRKEKEALGGGPRTSVQGPNTGVHCQACKGAGQHGAVRKRWRPLMLVIPLRLGLTEINDVYVESLKKCFTFKQSVGIIGGKPNHAHWFIGYFGDKLLYLDPHTTQPMVDLDLQVRNDESYHCPYPSMMKVMDLDPSIAVGFYCEEESDFNDLCSCIRSHITKSSKTPMFELYEHRPSHWPPYEPSIPQAPGAQGTSLISNEDSEEEFELI